MRTYLAQACHTVYMLDNTGIKCSRWAIFRFFTNSFTLHIVWNIDLYTHRNISSMNASSLIYIDVVIIWTMMSFYQQILHSFSWYKVLCIGNIAYAGHFAISPSTPFTEMSGLLMNPRQMTARTDTWRMWKIYHLI